TVRRRTRRARARSGRQGRPGRPRRASHSRGRCNSSVHLAVRRGLGADPAPIASVHAESPHLRFVPMTVTAALAAGVDAERRRLTCALVTPARDEEENVGRLAASLIAQTVLPLAWIVVDDGSTDGTAQSVSRLAEEHDWISVVSAAPDGGRLVDGRLTGRDVAAFQCGLAALPEAPDIVLKLDADVSLLPDFFDQLLTAFEADPKLGIAGG